MKKDMKIRVYSPEHSKAVQERLFEMGYRWLNNGERLQDYPEMYYLATNESGYITQGNKVFWEQYKADQRPECTLDDLYKPTIEEIMQECIKRFPKGSVVRCPQNKKVFTVSTEDKIKGYRNWFEGVYYLSSDKKDVLALMHGKYCQGSFLYYDGEYATLISKPKDWTEMSVEEWVKATKKLNLSWEKFYDHVKFTTTCPSDIFAELRLNFYESCEETAKRLYNEWNNVTPEYTVEELTKLVGHNFKIKK